ncbi:MAG: hypothetical protein IJD26_01560 [Lachnospiraceae bacterium]|nr:hypothetical protein [Lachnospiraceae bacterium]
MKNTIDLSTRTKRNGKNSRAILNRTIGKHKKQKEDGKKTKQLQSVPLKNTKKTESNGTYRDIRVQQRIPIITPTEILS